MNMARKKIPLPVAIDPDLHKRLGDWLASQPVAPSRTAVIEAALKDWLDRQAPPPSKQ